MRAPGKSRRSGYALIMSLLLLVMTSLAVTLALQRAQTDAQREREDELLFVGDQFRQAIRAYTLSPGLPSEYPARLEDLLEDKRWPSPRRYLRKIYPDPMTGRADWLLDLSQGRVIGVRSSSLREPLRHAGFPLDDMAFSEVASYSEWRFDAVISGRARAAVPQTLPPNGEGSSGQSGGQVSSSRTTTTP